VTNDISKRERVKHGLAQKKEVSHKKLGELSLKSSGRDPLVILKQAEKDRLPQLLPVKYSRMVVNAFAFFRGSVGIMAYDLAHQPHTKLMVQLCGDAHLQNLGCFAAPDGRVVFDINDFDETTEGPWEWDVKRMATSIVLAGLESKHDDKQCAASVDTFVGAYCKTMQTLAAEPVLTAARFMIHRLGKVAAVNAAFQQAQRSKPADLLEKYAQKVKGHYKFKKVEHVLWPASHQEHRQVLNSLKAYRQSLAPDRLHFFEFYQPVDVAFKIVGTGSVALRDYVVLMEGHSPDDALFLQVKQEVASTYAPYLKQPEYDNQGIRVVLGQRRIQAQSDLLLGWTRIGKFDYLVRQLNDHKGSLNLDNMRGKNLDSLAEVAGEILARGHARSGDAIAISSYLGDCEKVQKGIAEFAEKYAEQVKEDFEVFEKAVENKKILVG
jgi:uncharacterized protein (DUF2252 family)